MCRDCEKRNVVINFKYNIFIYRLGDTYLFWFILWIMVVVSKSAIATFAPGVEASVVKDTSTVGGATSCCDYHFLFQTLHQLRCVHVTARNKNKIPCVIKKTHKVLSNLYLQKKNHIL